MMRWAKGFKYAAGTVVFALILVMCIGKAADITERKDSDFKYAPFFEQEEDFDVLFLGTSHVINGIFPMELWNDFGIVSYNFGGHGNRIPVSYWVLENALEYTTPRLVVVDVLMVESDEKISPTHEYVHLSLDCFSVTKTKIEGIYDLFDDAEQTDENGDNPDKKLGYIWDFGQYHSRWNGLDENDVTNADVTQEKGAESRIAVAEPQEYSIVPQTEVLQKNTVGMDYLRKIIEDCQRRGIDVLLVHLPYPSTDEQQIAANSVYAIAEEYGVDYLNFVAMDSVVDYGVDCFDSYSHLNPSGARKVTKYLGDYIVQHYDIPDRREDERYVSWFDDYEEYIRYKIKNIDKQETLDTELMLLSDEGFSSCIYIKEDSPIFQDERMMNLVRNISQHEAVTLLDAAIESGSSYFLIVDNSWETIWESTGEDLTELSTTFGTVRYGNQYGVPYLYIQDSETNWLDGEWNEKGSDTAEPDMQVFVVNKYTGEVVAESRWNWSRADTVTKAEDIDD